MGKPVLPGGEKKVYVGESEGDSEYPATLDEALESAASKVVRDGLVSGDETAWFDITEMQVEIGNQHVKTYRVTVTPRPSG